jgi:hypothetical protein
MEAASLSETLITMHETTMYNPEDYNFEKCQYGLTNRLGNIIT